MTKFAKSPSSTRRIFGLLVALLLVASLLPIIVITTSEPVQASPDPSPDWYNSSWQYRKQITIDNTKVENENFTNFPVLIVTTLDNAKTMDNGDDILFTASDGTTKLNYEIERFDTENLTAWVRIPTLYDNENTVIYMYYGNALASNQENKAGTWDDNFKSVWHLNTSSWLDSTSTGNTLTAFGNATTGSGMVGTGVVLDGTGDWLKGDYNNFDDVNAGTFEFWLYYDTAVFNDGFLTSDTSHPKIYNSGGDDLRVNIDSTLGRVFDWYVNCSISTGVWTHFVVTFNSTIGITYKNGANIGEDTTPVEERLPFDVGTEPIYIGSNRGASDRDVDGTMDEARISNVVRSSAWIKTTFNNQNSPSTFYSVGSEEVLPGVLTFNSKYVVSSTTAVTTTSVTLVDDDQAIQTFDLAAPKTVLVIYQANSVQGATMPATGMQNAINVDGTDRAMSWDSGNTASRATRNAVFWVGTLGAGSHTVKGRFASNTSGSTATISNRVLLVMIFDGDGFYYIDDTTTATHNTTTFIDDPNAQMTFTPSAACKALVLYNISNSGATESTSGKKAAINIAGTDYGQAEKRIKTADYTDSVFTAHALSLSAVSTTVKGRFANAGAAETVTIHRRQLAVLLFDNSTLLDVITSTTQVSTTSSSFVDDAQATISRTTTDTRELLVVAVGTKRDGTSSSYQGEGYGIKINANDRANSRGSGVTSGANSAATAYAEQLAAGNHTVQGRFANNTGTTSAVIDARQVVALWFSFAPLPTPPGKPVLVSPENNYSTSDNTPTFTWTGGLGADNHRIEVDDNPDFSSVIDNVVRPITDNSWTKPSPGYAAGTYYWRVWAVNAQGENMSENTWQFTVLEYAWNLIESWSGTVQAPAAWQLIETWTGTVSAPAEWSLIETWTGTVQAPIAWQLIETWTGTVEALAEWQVVETWTGTVGAPAAWSLIETWTGTITAPAQWQLVETWTGTVQAPAAWQVIETWTGTVSSPAEWQLIESWTGTVEAPAEWQVVESWAGTVQAPVAWQLIEMWTGTVQAPTEWRVIETWTGTVSAPAEWKLIESWTGTVSAPAAWKLIETWTGTVSAPAVWQVIETWTGTVEAPVAWQLIETWAGTVSVPAEWQLIEMWTGTVEAPAAWQVVETWTGTVSAPAAWQLIETWTGTVEAPVAWQLIETWTGTVQALAAWQVVETWTGTINAPAQWDLIETWIGTVIAPAGWQLTEMWTGTVEAPALWHLIESWMGVVEAPLAWQLVETWTGAVEAVGTPRSRIGAVSPYWQTSAPYAVTATALDPDGTVVTVTLWYRYSAEGSDWSAWTPFDTDNESPWVWSFTAPEDDGCYEFYSVAKDNDNNEELAPAVADVQYGVDRVAPTVTSVVINGNAGSTSSVDVTISIDASDAISGLAEMRFSLNNVEWSDWGNFTANKSYTLPTGDGLKTVYVQVKDKAGLPSTVASDSITLETITLPAPPPPVVVPPLSLIIPTPAPVPLVFFVLLAIFLVGVSGLASYRALTWRIKPFVSLKSLKQMVPARPLMIPACMKAPKRIKPAIPLKRLMSAPITPAPDLPAGPFKPIPVVTRPPAVGPRRVVPKAMTPSEILERLKRGPRPSKPRISLKRLKREVFKEKTRRRS